MPRLFSYGTLRDAEMHRSTLGRVVLSTDDDLVGYRLSTVEVMDPAFVALTGTAAHANVVHSGRADHRVRGVVLEVTDRDLDRLDRYEAQAGYRRTLAKLASGREAWVYARSK